MARPTSSTYVHRRILWSLPGRYPVPPTGPGATAASRLYGLAVDGVAVDGAGMKSGDDPGLEVALVEGVDLAVVVPNVFSSGTLKALPVRFARS